ncbi:MAG: glycoside hydrolase family 3 N-terminal domain-containing protein [Bacteroidota bacterium]
MLRLSPRLVSLTLATLVVVGGCSAEREAEASPEADRVVPETAADRSRLDGLLEPYGALGAEMPPVPLSEAEIWADSVLATLSLDEAIGQLLVVDLNPRFLNGASSLVQVAEDWGVGGFHVPRRMPPREILRSTNLLHQSAKVPLFFTADYEWGPGQPGTTLTELPAAMAFGAAGDPLLAEAAGAVSAIEARAMGVNVLLAPVADVNNNPRNPIINTRSYGDDPRAVGRMAAAFVRGAQARGVHATLKHFPGHGNTGTDTHLAFDAVPGEWGDLSLTELGPYRSALAERPGVVMTAHLWMRALDREATPATFSRRALADVLRDSLGFRGLVMTDAIHMGALTSRYEFEDRILQPILAGADIVLNTYDPVAAKEVIRQAVEDGRLTRARIDRSVHRILTHKALLGLHRARLGRVERLERILAQPNGERVSEAVARASVTVVEPGPLPLQPDARVALVQLANFDARRATSQLERDLRAGGVNVLPIAPTTNAASRVEGLDAVVIGVHLQVAPAERPTLTQDQARVVDAILSRGTPAVVVLFGNPYAALDLNGSAGLLMAYDGIPRTASAVADVLLGRQAAPGRLPVDLPGRYRRGRTADLTL